MSVTEPRRRTYDSTGGPGTFFSFLWIVLTVPIAAEGLFGMWWLYLLAIIWTPFVVEWAVYQIRYFYWEGMSGELKRKRELKKARARLETAERWVAHRKEIEQIEAKIDKLYKLEDL